MNAHQRPLRILLAEDDADDQFIFEHTLEESISKFELLLFNDGQKAMDYLTRPPDTLPDIIFLDINMPCKTGKECLREIRSMHSLDSIPVVMLSTSNNPGEIEETLSCGAGLYIDKAYFYNNRHSIMASIFAPGWEQRLLKPVTAYFVR